MKELIAPFEKSLIIERPTGDIIRVNARGIGVRLPAIDFSRESKTAMGRTRTEFVSFSGDEFTQLYQYLQDALEHWQTEWASS